MVTKQLWKMPEWRRQLVNRWTWSTIVEFVWRETDATQTENVVHFLSDQIETTRFIASMASGEWIEWEMSEDLRTWRPSKQRLAFQLSSLRETFNACRSLPENQWNYQTNDKKQSLFRQPIANLQTSGIPREKSCIRSPWTTHENIRGDNDSLGNVQRNFCTKQQNNEEPIRFSLCPNANIETARNRIRHQGRWSVGCNIPQTRKKQWSNKPKQYLKAGKDPTIYLNI